MERGSLKLSVVLEAVTAAFNSGVSAARSNYSAAAQGIKKDSDDMAASGRKAGEGLLAALNVRSDGAIKAELAALVTQLAAFKNASGAPAAEVERITKAAEGKIAALRQELAGVGPAAASGVPSLASMGRELLGVVGVVGGLAGVAAGLKAIVDTALTFERINKQLEFSVGSAKAAKVEFEFIRTAARGMGIDVLTAAEGYAKLAAATRGTALEGKATRDVFLGVSQAAATMGLSTEQTNGTFLALAQIASKGKVSMEELRGQLGERLPPAMKIAADSLGVTTARLEKLVETGLDADEFLSAFGPALQKAFSAEAAKNVGTLGGSIANLKNDFKELLNFLASSGITAGVTSVFGDLSTVIKNIQTTLKNVDPSTMNAVVETLKQLYSVGKETFSALLTAVGGVNTLLNDATKAVSSLVGAFTGVGSSADKEVGLVTRSLQGISILVGLLSDGVYGIRIAFTAVTGATQAWYSAIALGLSKVTFGKLSEELKQVSRDLESSSKTSFANADALAQKFTGSAKAALDAAAGNAQDNANKTGAAYVAAAGQVAGAATQIADAATAGSIATASGAAAAVEGLKFVGAEALASATRIRSLGDGGSSALGAVGVAAEAAKIKVLAFSGAGGTATIEVSKAADGASDAFKGLATTLGVSLPPGVQNIAQMGQALGAVVVSSDRVSRQLGQELPAQLANLNAVDLSAFRDAFIGGLEKAGASAEVLKARMLDLDTAIAKTLGADLGAAQTGLTQAFQDNVKNLDSLLGRLDTLRKNGVDTGILVKDALDGMVGKAKNVSEVNAVIERLKAMGESGQLTGRQVAEGLEKARSKIDDLKPGISSVAEAFRTFGFQTREEARLMAEKYLQAYQIMKASGTATAEELTVAWKRYTDSAILGQQGLATTAAQAFAQLGLKTREELLTAAAAAQQAFILVEGSGQATKEVLRAAFRQYAEATIAANNGVVSSFLQVKAAALGLKIDVDGTGKANIVSLTGVEQKLDNVNLSYQNLQAAAKGAGNEGVKAADDTAAALDRQAAAAGRAAQATAAAGSAGGKGGSGRPRASAFDSEVSGIAAGRGGISAEGGFAGDPLPSELYAAVKSMGGSDGLASRMQSQVKRFYNEVYLGEGTLRFFSWDKFEAFVANEVNRERQSVAQGGPEDPGGQAIGRSGDPTKIRREGPRATPGYDPNRPGARPAPPRTGVQPPQFGLQLPTPGTSTPGGERRILVEFKGDNGKSVTASMPESQEIDFTRLLKRAKGLA